MTIGIENRLGHSFKDASMLVEALTHSSYANDISSNRHNERLEFLGDAVLELCVSERLFRAHPDWDEGRMTHERSRLVRESTLAVWARSIGIDREIRVGRSLQANRDVSQSILADAMEAVIGAVFLDGGIEPASSVIQSLLARCSVREGDGIQHDKDAKTALQELLQAQGKRPPRYAIKDRSGPDHAPTFKVELLLDDAAFTYGDGPSIKAAEFKAAEAALEKLAR